MNSVSPWSTDRPEMARKKALEETLRGGQGRTAGDVEADGRIAFWLFLIAFVLSCGALAWRVMR